MSELEKELKRIKENRQKIGFGMTMNEEAVAEHFWYKALKWAKAGMESPAGKQYEIPLKRINAEIEELENGKT